MAPTPAATPSGKSRKTLIVGAVVAVVLVLGAVVVVSKLGGDDGGSSSALASDGTPLPSGSGPSSEPEESWTAKGDCETNEDDYSGCYVIADDDGVFGYLVDDGDVRLVSLDPSSGDEKWDTNLDSDEYANLLDGHLFVYHSGDDGDADLALLDRSNGDEIWKESLDGYGYPTGAVTSEAVLASEDDGDSTIALSLDDGNDLWSEKGSFVALCADTVYLNTEDELRAVDAGSGDEIWSTDLDGDSSIYDAGCTSNGVATLISEWTDDSEDYRLTVYGESDGDKMWSENLDPDDSPSYVEVSDDVVMVGGYEKVYAFDAAKGDDLWDAKTGSGDYPDSAVVGGNLLVVHSGDAAKLLDPGSGDKIASESIDDGFTYPFPKSLLVVGDGEVTALSTSDLEKQWSVDVDDVADGALGGGRLYAVTPDGIVAYD